MPANRDLFSLAAGLKKADVQRRKLTREAIRAVLVTAADRAVETIPKDGIGRRIWGKKNSGLKKLVRTEKVAEVGDSFEAGVNVVGLAGLIEKGGRTERHDIKSKGRVLARRAGENHGRVFFVKASKFVGPIQKGKRRRKGITAISHPGGPVAAKHRVREALEYVRPTFTHALVEALDRSMEAANG